MTQVVQIDHARWGKAFAVCRKERGVVAWLSNGLWLPEHRRSKFKDRDTAVAAGLLAKLAEAEKA